MQCSGPSVLQEHFVAQAPAENILGAINIFSAINILGAINKWK